MSKPKPAAVQPAPPLAPDEAKPLTLIGLESTPQGYVVVSAVVQGDRVVKREAHCTPQGKQWAALLLRRLLLQKVLFPGGR